MTQTSKYLIASGVLLIIVIILIAYYNKQKADEKKIADLEKQNVSPGIERVCYDLPTSPDVSTFGPKFWAAFHDLASRVPCGGCKSFAEKFITYMHDLVNIKTGANIFDLANYTYFNSAIAKLNTGVPFADAFQLNNSH